MTDLPPGPELDRLVAEKVMGWPKLHEEYDRRQYPCWSVWDYRPRNDFVAIMVFRSEYDLEDNGLADRWSPSATISHAWEVVEHLRSTRFVALEVTVRTKHRGGGWYCSGIDMGDAAEDDYEMMPGVHAEALTAPHAICLAALRAVS